MTREEIVEGLKLLEDNMVHFDELQNDKGKWIDVHELLFEAIQALSQEPISLNDINNALEESFRNGVRSAKVEQEPTVDEMEREYEKSKALFHKIVECDDAISHKVVEDIKADIEAARYGLINDGLDVALRIIDKHIEGR